MLAPIFFRAVVIFLSVLLVVSSFLMPMGCASAAEPAVIVFDDYPPYHYWAGDTPQGLNIAIIKEAFALMGEPVRFERMPWKRSLASIRQGTVTAMCAGLKTPERERFGLYPDEYLSLDENMVFALAGSGVAADTLDDLRSLGVGVAAEYSYGPGFDSLGDLDRKVYINDERLVRVLLGGRVDVAVGNRLVLPFLAERMGGGGKLRPLINLGGEPLYLIFSRARGREAKRLADGFDQAMGRMRSSGRLAAIRRSYTKTIVVGADEWCPYNCVPGSRAPGYVIELMRRIFSANGYSVKYVVKPWERVLHETRMGYVDAAVGAIPGEAPGLVYPDMECGVSRNGLFRADPGWRYAGSHSLDGLVFGVASGYSYGEVIDGLISSGRLHVEAMGGEAPLEANIKMLLRGRMDGIVADTSVVAYTAGEMGVADSIHYGGSPDPGSPLYVAFSPEGENSLMFARMFSEGMEKLRRSGELRAILAKYNLTDWR